jgi:L-threonylcarbamoyladenylate synthase
MLTRPDIYRSTQQLLKGGVICYPTEGVFGLGCLPFAKYAIARILHFKQRPVRQGLILLGANIEQLLPWIDPSATELSRLKSNSKLPTTWIVTRSEIAPDWITGGRNTVAVRICRHPVVQLLCLNSNSALVSTSANRSGRPAVKTTLRARYLLNNKVDNVVSGRTDADHGASEIRLADSGRVIRSA